MNMIIALLASLGPQKGWAPESFPFPPPYGIYALMYYREDLCALKTESL